MSRKHSKTDSRLGLDADISRFLRANPADKESVRLFLEFANSMMKDTIPIARKLPEYLYQQNIPSDLTREGIGPIRVLEVIVDFLSFEEGMFAGRRQMVAKLDDSIKKDYQQSDLSAIALALSGDRKPGKAIKREIRKTGYDFIFGYMQNEPELHKHGRERLYTFMRANIKGDKVDDALYNMSLDYLNKPETMKGAIYALKKIYPKEFAKFFAHKLIYDFDKRAEKYLVDCLKGEELSLASDMAYVVLAANNRHFFIEYNKKLEFGDEALELAINYLGAVVQDGTRKYRTKELTNLLLDNVDHELLEKKTKDLLKLKALPVLKLFRSY